MKKLILSVLLALSFSLTFAQDLNSLKEEANKAYIAGSNMNFEGIFETTYPKVFDIVSKEMMQMGMEQMFNNEDFSIKLVQVEPHFEFSEIKQIDQQKFCMVDHDTKMIMIFKEKMEDAQMMVDIFKSSMETEEVTFDEKENAFHIKVRSTMVGVSDEITKNQWKFINKDKSNQLINMIFSEDVIKQLGL
jgi:hypothetical protein